MDIGKSRNGEIKELFNENFRKLGAAAQRVSPREIPLRTCIQHHLRTLPYSYVR